MQSRSLLTLLLLWCGSAGAEETVRKFDEILKGKKAAQGGGGFGKPLNMAPPRQNTDSTAVPSDKAPEIPPTIELTDAQPMPQAGEPFPVPQHMPPMPEPAPMPPQPQKAPAAPTSCFDFDNCLDCLAAHPAAGQQCAWQGPSGCQPGCMVMDQVCFKGEAAGSRCPESEATCATHSTCEKCVEAGCSFQQSKCRDLCKFGPMGAFIAKCAIRAEHCDS